MPDLNYQRKPVRRPRDVEAERMALWDWLTPLIMICASVAALIAVPLVAAGPSAQVAFGAGLVVLAVGVVKTILAVGVAIGCSWVLGIGFDALGRGTLRLAAVALTATAVSALLGPFIGCFSIAVYLGLVMILLTTMLDLDASEAAAFTVAFVVVEVVAWVVLAAVMRSM